jgi:group I intron endonuclease
LKMINRLENSVSGIYEIINVRNQKRYIGQTKNLYRRQCSHIGKLRRNIHPNKHLQNAWNKYGEDVFQFRVLEYCPLENLDARELFWINCYQSNQVGYNIRIDPVNNRGVKWSEEHREKMGKIINDENSWFKNHIIPRVTMEKAWEASRNRIWTQEERERHSKRMTGVKTKDTSRMKAAQTGENNGDAKLTELEAKQIIYLLDRGYESALLADIYKVAFGTISAIKRCRAWTYFDRNTVLEDAEIGKLAMERLHKYIKSNLKPIEKSVVWKIYLPVEIEVREHDILERNMNYV